MKNVEQDVYLIAEPQIHWPAVDEWLGSLGVKDVEGFIEHQMTGTEGEQLVELAARRCYLSYQPGLNPNVTKVRTDSAEYHNNILNSKHGSVMEHANFTFAIENVSRVFCFHPDVEILTISGWKRCDELAQTDVLLTKDPKTGLSRWSVPRSVQQFQYSGKLLYWENSECTLPPTTPDHLMWAAIYQGSASDDILKADKVRASELFGDEPLTSLPGWNQPRPRTFVVDNSIKYVGEDLDLIRIGSKVYDAELFIEWLGLLSTDGAIPKGENHVEISQTKIGVKDRLRFLFDKLFQGGWHAYGEGHQLFRVNDKELRDFCILHIGRTKSERKFSPWLMGLSDKLLKKFCYGAMLGDGVVHSKNGHRVLACTTHESAKMWQTIFARLGQASNVRQSSTRIGDLGRIVNGASIVCTQPENSLSIHQKGQSRFQPKDRRSMDYSGYVYCPETSDGIVFARYQGKALWTCNTHEWVRHRAGVAHSQESMRYVRMDEFGFWLPPEIRENEAARNIFENVVSMLEEAQRQLLDVFSDEFTNGGFSKKKQLTSAFRRIAPDGLATGIVTTLNARALRHIIELRSNPGAEVEVRRVVDMIARMVTVRFPYFFGDFERTYDEVGIPVWTPKYSKV